jgi:hypothetical protein
MAKDKLLLWPGMERHWPTAALGTHGIEVVQPPPHVREVFPKLGNACMLDVSGKTVVFGPHFVIFVLVSAMF